jgi:hypothetical protein
MGNRIQREGPEGVKLDLERGSRRGKIGNGI